MNRYRPISNVAFWIANEQYLHDLALQYIRRTRSKGAFHPYNLETAAMYLLLHLQRACNATPENPATTPDGDEYTHENIVGALKHLVVDGIEWEEE